MNRTCGSEFLVKVEVSSKKSYLMIHWEKTKYYFISIEFQERGSPRPFVHMDFQCT